MIDLSALEWMLKGYCSIMQANPDIFYEDGNESTAKAFCYQCSVIDKCREFAIANDEAGVWGGTSEADRRAARRGGPRASCPACNAQALFQGNDVQICLSCGLSWH